MRVSSPQWSEEVGISPAGRPRSANARAHASSHRTELRVLPAASARSRPVSSAVARDEPARRSIPRNASAAVGADRRLGISVASGLSAGQNLTSGKERRVATTICATCDVDLGGRVLRGEVLFADDIVTIFEPKASRATVNRWLRGPVLSGESSVGIRGRWITVVAFEADLRKLGCALELSTLCPACGAALDGYLIRPEIVDAWDIVEYFSGRVSLDAVQTWFKRKLLRGRKTPGIRGYWTTSREFHDDVRKLKGARTGIAPRVVVAHG